MATIFTRDFTAANGTSWADVGFQRIYGGAFDATVSSNAGACGATANERVWMVSAWPQTPGHKVAVDLDWSNAAGAGRAPGVGVRWTPDGANGYVAELDSNIGTARARIRRRRAGVWTTIVAWTDISAHVSSAALNAGVTVELRCANEDGQVALSFRVSGTERLSYDDTSTDRIEAAGAPALLIDGNSTVTDVTYDSVTVRDLADEWAGSGSLSTDTALVVDGVSYSFEDLVAAGVFVGGGRQSYDQGDGWEFTTSDLMDTADSILYPGAVVKVALDGVVVAYGRIQASSRRLTPGEGRAYRLVPARTLAADVVLEHPSTHTNSITWNLPTDHADYEASYANKEIGEAIAAILDAHADGATGLRAHLAAPPDESTLPYVQAELDLLTLKVPAMTVSGDPVTAVEQLLAFTKYVLFIDPDTLIWHVKDRTAGTIKQVDLDVDHVLGEYRIDPERNFTACVLYGSKPETSDVTLTNAALGGLEPQWATALESSVTSEKQAKNKDGGLVSSIGGSAGAPTMTPDTVGPPAFSMAASEWVLCVVTFVDGAEAGNSYTVTSNTTLAFTLVGPWVAGGPTAGDEFVVRGNAAGGGRDNAYSEIGRRYKLTDVDSGIPDDACVHVRITQGNVEKIAAAKVVTPEDGSGPAEVVLDIATIGWVTYAADANPDPCEAGGAVTEADVSVTLPTFSRSDPRTPRLWFPRDGSGNDAYRGTAYTTDAAKWDGGGTPGRGDPGVMRALIQNAPEYAGSAAEDAEWDAVFDEMLSYMGTLARSVTITIGGVLDTQYAGLGQRLQVLNGPTELETLTDLTILAVEWDVPGNTTTLYAGTLAAGPYDVQRMREAAVAVNVKRRQRRETGLLEKLRDCLSTNQHSAGYARPLPPTQICAGQVTSGVTASGRSSDEDHEHVWVWIQEIWEWLAEQKGTEGGSDPDGSLWIDKDGQWLYSLDGGQTWLEQTANDGPTSKGGSGAANGDPAATDPMPEEPDDLGSGSIEDIIWQAVLGILGNLGKTIDMATGRVVAPGTVNNGTNNPDGSPWITFGPAATPDGAPDRTPVGSGGTVPPTNEAPKEPVLANLMKTQEPDGTIPEPGSTVPDGGTFHGPGGQVPVPNGGYVPPSILTTLFADWRVKGLSLVALDDPSGVIYSHPDGAQYRMDAVGYATTPLARQVGSVTAGTGDNDGDYEETTGGKVIAPSERVNFDSAEGDGFAAETPGDGLGLYLANGSTTSIVTDAEVMPSGAKGYTKGSAQLAVVFRGDDAGDGAGNFRVRVYSTWRPGGGAAETEVEATNSPVTVANPGNGGQTVTKEFRVEEPVDTTPGVGTTLSVRVERVGGDAADTATDRLCVLDVSADVPMQAGTVGSRGYA